MNTILVIGTGQIGKATLFRLLKSHPQKVVIHNLTKQESEDCIKLLGPLFKETKFIESHGNIFMPYSLKDVAGKDLMKHSKEIIEYFYSELNEEILKNSTIYRLVSKYRPETPLILLHFWVIRITQKKKRIYLIIVLLNVVKI